MIVRPSTDTLEKFKATGSGWQTRLAKKAFAGRTEAANYR
jgi:uncharacterized protein (DUF4415 family)